MALKYFLPGRELTREQLDKLSHKQPGLGAWWFPAVAEMRKLGLRIIYIERFDYAEFYERGEDYLYEFYVPEIADWFLNKSNLRYVMNLIPRFLKEDDVQTRRATMEDIENLLNEGWLVGLEINVRILQERPGLTAI